MRRLAAAVRRALADPNPSPIGPRPWSVRICDAVIFASPARRWS
jgi:hypothetical protein